MNTSSGFPLFSGPWSLITSVNGGPWTPCHLGVLSPLLQGTGREGHLLGMILFALTRLFGTFISCTDSLSFPEGLPRDQRPSFPFPAALKDPRHLHTSCCTAPRAAAARTFSSFLPHTEAKELREHRLSQCSRVGSQKERQAEEGMRTAALQMLGQRMQREGDVTENQ